MTKRNKVIYPENPVKMQIGSPRKDLCINLRAKRIVSSAESGVELLVKGFVTGKFLPSIEPFTQTMSRWTSEFGETKNLGEVGGSRRKRENLEG